MTATEQHALLTLWLKLAPEELSCYRASINEQVAVNGLETVTWESLKAESVEHQWDRLTEYWDWQREQQDYHDMQRGY